MNIFLTGSTGFLGGELLVSLSKHEEVNKIYCLVRAISEEHAVLRLKHVFELHGDEFDPKKIIPILGNIGEHDFSHVLLNNKMIQDTNIIVHSAANTSFSKIYDKIVEQVNISGVNELIKWSLTLPNLDTFVYVGTATIAGKEANHRVIMEEESPNPKVHHVVKYTYTKMMGEMLLAKHLPKEKVLIVRPSIIMGDSRDWLPRSYVILWAIETANMLRLVPVNRDSALDVIPVDFASASIVALLFAPRKYPVYHISAGKNSCTSVGKVMDAIEPSFPGLPAFKFIQKPLISQMKLWAKGKLTEGSELYQYANYLDYWKSIFDDVNQMRILLAALEPYLEFAELGQIFDNTKLLADTGFAPPEPAHNYLARSAKYLKNIDVFAGAVDP
ncbi:MAG TPA: SDR family oxidoreductase [Bacteroidia bacterium]|jgi:thioester reductase-like protein|nr:SDR family oxidoreductase [Bacteroidia bacterium]